MNELFSYVMSKTSFWDKHCKNIAALRYLNFSLLCVFVISYEGNEIGVDSKETQWR